MRKKTNVFDFTSYPCICTADFETSTDAWGVDIARVWLWDICDDKLNHITGTDLGNFMAITLSKTCLYAFHNLAYDGMYILYWLLKNGYKHRILEDKRYTLNDGEFTTLISDMGQHYYYQVRKGKHTITFMDSLKYIHMSVSKIADLYDLPIKKGKINYDDFREVGYIPNDEEIDYIRNDTEIMMRAIQVKLDNGETRFTQSGNARFAFKDTFDKLEYKNLFPDIDIHEDKILRHAYVGGFTYNAPEKVGKDLYDLTSWDCNSMYPDKMLHCLMPYGLPIFRKGKYEHKLFNHKYPLFIQHIRCMFVLKEGKTPMIPKKKVFARLSSEYLTSSNLRIVDLWLSNPDYELFFDNYTVCELEYVDYVMFKGKAGVEITPEEASNMTLDEVIEADGKGSMFYEYFKGWRYIKEHEEGAKRVNAKLMQNALYGCFATNPLKRAETPYLEDDVVKFERTEAKETKGFYLPVAIFVTAYSRKMLIDLINLNRERFIYCDTDSLYMLGQEPPKGIKIHNSLYGYFKEEHIIEKARFLGAKRYIYYACTPKDGEYKWTVACCGAPPEVQKKMTWDNFYAGNEFDGKLAQKTVKGGKHLRITTYRLNI